MPDKVTQPPRTHEVLARALAEHRDGNFRQAVEHYTEVLTADRKQTELRFYLGAAEQDRGEVTAALDGFRKAVDLVTTIDLVTAHIAGALGRPVWLMLKYTPECRWTEDGNATPWYPTTPLFRQPMPDEWGGVVDSIAQALDEFE